MSITEERVEFKSLEKKVTANFYLTVTRVFCYIDTSMNL